jgi:hypothetical protein
LIQPGGTPVQRASALGAETGFCLLSKDAWIAALSNTHMVDSTSSDSTTVREVTTRKYLPSGDIRTRTSRARSEGSLKWIISTESITENEFFCPNRQFSPSINAMTQSQIAIFTEVILVTG